MPRGAAALDAGAAPRLCLRDAGHSYVSELEGIGEAVTGGMAARAVEPEAGQGHGDHHEKVCLNCGTYLQGAYCHACGQKGHLHRTLGGFWHDLVHGVFHFEGKIWRTLPMLAWRPGDLTRRYIHGERARFVSPVALFLFSVFLMFVAFSAIGGPFGVNQTTTVTGQESAGSPAAAPAPPPPPASDRPTANFDLSDVAKKRGWTWISDALKKWQKNPSLMLYKLQANAYKYSWVLIPISVPFLALLFLWRRRHQRAYDHTVFVTYSISFATMLLILLSFARSAGLSEDGVLLVLMLVMPVHMFRQLQGAYQLRFFSALWRAVALSIFSATAVLLFLMLALVLGAM